MTKTPDDKKPTLTGAFAASTPASTIDGWAQEQIVKLKREFLVYEKKGSAPTRSFLRDQAHILAKDGVTGREIESAFEAAHDPAGKRALQSLLDPVKCKLFTDIRPVANAFLDTMAEFQVKFREAESLGFTPEEISGLPGMNIGVLPTLAETIQARSAQQSSPTLFSDPEDQKSREDHWEAIKRVLKDDVLPKYAEQQFAKYWHDMESGTADPKRHLRAILDVEKIEYFKDPAHAEGLTGEFHDRHLAPNPHRPPIPHHHEDVRLLTKVKESTPPPQPPKRKPPTPPSSRNKH